MCIRDSATSTYEPHHYVLYLVYEYELVLTLFLDAAFRSDVSQHDCCGWRDMVRNAILRFAIDTTCIR